MGRTNLGLRFPFVQLFHCPSSLLERDDQREYGVESEVLTEAVVNIEEDGCSMIGWD